MLTCRQHTGQVPPPRRRHGSPPPGSFTLVLILIGAGLRLLLTAPTMGVSLWESWIFVVDTSAHADEESTGARPGPTQNPGNPIGPGEGVNPPPPPPPSHPGQPCARLSALLMTVGGMFIFAMMIGLISDGLAAQLAWRPACPPPGT